MWPLAASLAPVMWSALSSRVMRNSTSPQAGRRIPWLDLGMAAGSALLGMHGQRQQNVANAREARLNREFQERMSSTAHQREALDLRKAGLNPQLSVGSGASTPTGDRAEFGNEIGAGVSSALAVRAARAQIRLTESQAQLTEDQALKTRAEVGRYEDEANAGRFQRLVSERELAEMSVREREILLEFAKKQAQAELDATLSSARAAQARAKLDEAMEAGARNVEAFEKSLGERSQWLRLIINILRSVR